MRVTGHLCIKRFDIIMARGQCSVKANLLLALPEILEIFLERSQPRKINSPYRELTWSVAGSTPPCKFKSSCT